MNSPSILFSLTVFFLNASGWECVCARVWVCNKLTTAALDSRCQPTDINKIGGKLAKKKNASMQTDSGRKTDSGKKNQFNRQEHTITAAHSFANWISPTINRGPRAHTHTLNWLWDGYNEIHTWKISEKPWIYYKPNSWCAHISF